MLYLQEKSCLQTWLKVPGQQELYLKEFTTFSTAAPSTPHMHAPTPCPTVKLNVELGLQGVSRSAEVTAQQA